MYEKVIDTSGISSYYRGSSWINKLSRGPKQKTTKNSTIDDRSSQAVVLFYALCHWNGNKKPPLHGRRLYSWWSCRVLPPSPKGNRLFVFKHSHMILFRTPRPSYVTHMVRSFRQEMSPYNPDCTDVWVRSMSITPDLLCFLRESDGCGN